MSELVIGERRTAWQLYEYELDHLLTTITVEWDGNRWWQLISGGQRFVGFSPDGSPNLFFSEREALREQLRRYEAERESIDEAIREIRTRLG